MWTPTPALRDLSEADVIALRDYIEANYQTEGDLRREVQADIRRKVEIGSPIRACATAAVSPCVDSAPTQRAYPQGQAQDGRRQEEGRQVSIRAGVWSSHGTPEGREEVAPQREEERGVRPRPHQEHVQQHDRHHHRPAGSGGPWSSSGQVGFKGSRKSTPYAAQMAAESAARRAMDHGMRKVDVFVKGPGSGRETAIRSLQATGLEVGRSRTSPRSPQRLPSAQAASSLRPRSK